MANKKYLKKQILKYAALFEPQKEGGFTVTIPSLPGCISEGESFEDAVKNIKEAMVLYLEDASCKDLQNIYSPVESFVAPVEVSLV